MTKMIVKIITLGIVSLWSIQVWALYFDAKNIVNRYQADSLSDAFWQWEAQGRLSLIDAVLYDNSEMADLPDFAESLAVRQNEAYGMPADFVPAKIVFTPLKGEANGFYAPEEGIVMLNSRMDWHSLPGRRLTEVILHENMHHILSHYAAYLDEDANLYNDFVSLSMAARNPENPRLQEEVAYRAQRVGLYASLGAGNDRSAWDVSALMGEINLVKETANSGGN